MEKGNGEVQDEREQNPGADAQQPTDCAERNSFEGELEQDVSLGCSNGLAHADFPGSLSHRDEHDVHHPHAAHHQADRGNGDYE